VHYLLETVTTMSECTITKAVMHAKLVFKNLVLLTYPKQLLVFEKCTLKCALSNLKCGNVIDSEASDLLRVTNMVLGLVS